MSGALPPSWDADDTLVCVEVRAETADVRTFVFAGLEPRLFRFEPGQFVTLSLGDGEVRRCYTIASPPTRPWRIEVTSKRVPGGPGSGWLHESVRAGTRVQAGGPAGDFHLLPRDWVRYLFLSAGAGITPLMSMARAAHDLGGTADILFVHSARSPADVVFGSELAAMARRPGFRRATVVEAVPDGTGWDGLRGRLSPAMLAALVPDLLAREVYCCGPAPYMAAVRAMLAQAGHDPARYHQESFDFAAGGDDAPDAAAPSAAPGATRSTIPSIVPLTVPDIVPATAPRLAPVIARAPAVPAATPSCPAAAVTEAAPGILPGIAPYARPSIASDVLSDAASSAGPDAVPAPVATFSVRFARLGRTVSCPAGSTVLAAARAAGLRLPAACNKGVCGTCKSRLLSGTVELRHGGGIRRRELDEGWTLPCCARPLADLVVDR